MEMTIREAAIHLDVCIQTVRRKIDSGELPGTKVKNKWMVTVKDKPPTREGIDSQAEITWLREQLETRTREVSELHQLLAAHSLNPGRTTSPWWAFWR